jgi:hypothetical protein
VTHRAALREWVWKVHLAGTSQAEIADLANSTIAQVGDIIEQITALDTRSDLTCAGGRPWCSVAVETTLIEEIAEGVQLGSGRNAPRFGRP